MHPPFGCRAFLLVGYFSFASFASAVPIQTYFNHDPRHSYTEPYRSIHRAGHDFEAILESSILSAQKTIDVAVYELSLPKVAKALAHQAKTGVMIRLVLEHDHSRPLSELTPTEVSALDGHGRERYEEFVRLVDTDKDGSLSSAEIEDRDALVILRRAGIPWIDDASDGSMGSGLMHHKFLIVDGKATLVSSANFTTSDVHGDFKYPDSRGNSNGLLIFHSEAVSRVFLEEFNTLWNRRFGLKKLYRPPRTVQVDGREITIQFSPSSKKLGWEASVNGLIAREILKAKTIARLALFVFSEQLIANALEALEVSGGQVKALIDPSFAYRNYSELLDILGLRMLDDKCRYETGNRPWAKPSLGSGIPRLPTGDKLHHKFGVLDRDTVLFGSHNWSAAANHTNDENFLVVRDSTVASEFGLEFDRLYKVALTGPPQWLTKKIKDLEESCGQSGERSGFW